VHIPDYRYQGRKEEFPVFVILVDGLAPVTARGDMIKRAGKLDAE